MENPDPMDIIIVIICISGPLFFLTSIVLVKQLIVATAKNRENLKQEREKAINGQKYLDEKNHQLKNQIAMLSDDALKTFRLKWFEEIASATYNSEIEVEIKFIYDFLRFLNYGVNDFRTRVSVEVPVGRQKVTGVADWVVYNHRYENPLLVIEAKEPNQQLNLAVKEQARSYSYALKTPYYMLRNGRDIQIFERRIDDDVCVISGHMNDLPSFWQIIEETIGNR